jgi:DNA-binding transcriptional LysR family regulator
LLRSPGIEIRHLRYFLAVYEELHFGRAAKRLHIAQPPLSHAIRKLETELGTQLLERTSRKVRATAAGHAFAEEAAKVVSSFNFAVSEAQRAGRNDPLIHVGCAIHISSGALHRFLTALTERDGDLRAEVTHLLGAEQVGRLRSGELDLGVFSHADDYEGLGWERLFPGETLHVFLPKSHPLASKSTLVPSDLATETFLCSARSVNPAFWDLLMSQLDRGGYRFARRRETTTDPRDVFMAVAGRLGFALGPASFREVSLVLAQGLVSIPLDPPISYPDTIVAWRADPPRHLSSRLAAVREAAAELFAATSPQLEAAPGR